MKRKLNYRFHNPNDDKTTADHILKVLIEANEKKLEEAIKNEIQDETESIKLAG